MARIDRAARPSTSAISVAARTIRSFVSSESRRRIGGRPFTTVPTRGTASTKP